jgi:hypothetical protein
LLATISLSFPSFEDVLNPCSFFKGIFNIQSTFLLGLESYYNTFFLAFMVFGEKFAILQVGFPLSVKHQFSLFTFKIFYFVFRSQKFDHVVTFVIPL